MTSLWHYICKRL